MCPMDSFVDQNHALALAGPVPHDLGDQVPQRKVKFSSADCVSSSLGPALPGALSSEMLGRLVCGPDRRDRRLIRSDVDASDGNLPIR